MRIIYLTAKTYPASTADHLYIRELARAFYGLLGNNFSLVVAGNRGSDLNGLPVIDLGLRFSHLRTIYYFFWFPFFLVREKINSADTVIFSNDINLISVATFWSKVLSGRYRICSDWHMLFGGLRERISINGSDRMVTTSEKLRKAIIGKYGVNPSKLAVVYGGVDLKLFPEISKEEARKKLNLPLDKKIIAYVGGFKTMGMEKGILTMIEALNFLPSDVIMLFAGGKDTEIEEYRRLAAGGGVSNRIMFFGRYGLGESYLYQSADILSIPYPDEPHFREYGFPMKVYEYMASVRPIIYSILDMVEEVIGDCAFPFKPGDSGDFAKTAENVLENIAASGETAKKAYGKLKGFVWEEKAKNILGFIEHND